MGERKGVNKWYPPDYDPSKGGLNKSQGTHALRERARKLHLGILIIRFEMPYNIWCEGCKNHIGMGVRYNAEKKKVGMYYTTPVYQFRMKCHLCDNHFEIKTDPANLDYEIISGARRQERRWDPTENGQVVPDDKDKIKRLYDDAMFKLEHGDEDANKGKDAKPRIAKLTAIQDRVKDDYMANRILRDGMRAKRKERKQQAAVDDALRKKASLNIDLVPENEEDIRVAGLMRLTASESAEEMKDKSRDQIVDESIFTAGTSAAGTPAKKSKLAALESLASAQRVRRADEKTNPLKNIGVVFGKGKGKGKKSAIATPAVKTEEEAEEVKVESEEIRDESGNKDPVEEVKVEETGEEDKKPEEKKGLLSLCDYGSSSSDQGADSE